KWNMFMMESSLKLLTMREDKNIMVLDKLVDFVSMSGQVLWWFNSYLSEKAQCMGFHKVLFWVLCFSHQASMGDGFESHKPGACLAFFESWLSANFPLLNLSMAEMLIIELARLCHSCDTFTLCLDDCVIHCRDRVRSFGVLWRRTRGAIRYCCFPLMTLAGIPSKFL
uniref:Uncharacterized protein n=1 Tax=Sphaeramia orbicularis TaxID=375764 RepID=A0A673AR32_9TELE